METKKNYTLPIIMMILLFGMISFVTNLAAPMGVVLKNKFGVSTAMGSLGNLMNFIAYAVMGIPGGLLLQRVGYKKTALIAVAIGFLGIFIQFLSGHSGESMAFYIYLLGAFVAGFSMTLLNTVVNPMLNTLGGGGNKGNQLIQTGGAFNSIFATFTPAFVGILIGETTKAQISNVFPVLYIAMGIFALVGIVLWAVSIPEPHAQRFSEPLGNLMVGALKFRHFILGAVGIFAYVGVEVGTPAYANYWLSDIPEYGAIVGGSVAASYWFLMFIGRLFGASIGAKVSSKKMLTFASVFAMIMLALAIFSPSTTKVTLPLFQKSEETGALSFDFLQVPINAMFIVLVGLCTSIMWGSIYNLAVEGLGKYLAVASGIFMTLVCGGGIIPYVQGLVADWAGYMPSYWVMFAGFAYLLFYALIGSKNVNKDISTT